MNKKRFFVILVSALVVFSLSFFAASFVAHAGYAGYSYDEGGGGTVSNDSGGGGGGGGGGGDSGGGGGGDTYVGVPGPPISGPPAFPPGNPPELGPVNYDNPIIVQNFGIDNYGAFYNSHGNLTSYNPDTGYYEITICSEGGSCGGDDGGGGGGGGASPISPPGDFSLSLGGSVACNYVPLSWTSSSGAQAYRILKGNPRVDISPYQPYTALNFTDTTVSQNTTYQYQIEAYNPDGTKRSNSLNVDTPNCPPTLNFSANPTSIFQGQSSTLTWSSANAASCVASGGWSGGQPTNGSQIVVPLPPPSVTYNLQCSGPGGSVSNSATVNITPLALPDWREIIPR